MDDRKLFRIRSKLEQESKNIDVIEARITIDELEIELIEKEIIDEGTALTGIAYDNYERIIDEIRSQNKTQLNKYNELLLSEKTSRTDQINALRKLVSHNNDKADKRIDAQMTKIKKYVNNREESLSSEIKSYVHESINRLSESIDSIRLQIESLNGYSVTQSVPIRRSLNIGATVWRDVSVPKYWTGTEHSAGELFFADTGTRSFGNEWGYPHTEAVEAFIREWNNAMKKGTYPSATIVPIDFTQPLDLVSKLKKKHTVEDFWKDLTHEDWKSGGASADTLVSYRFETPADYSVTLFAGNTAVAGTWGAVSNELALQPQLARVDDWDDEPDDSSYIDLDLEVDQSRTILEGLLLGFADVSLNRTGILAAIGEMVKVGNKFAADLKLLSDWTGEAGDVSEKVSSVSQQVNEIVSTAGGGIENISQLEGSTIRLRGVEKRRRMIGSGAHILSREYNVLQDVNDVDDLIGIGTESLSSETNLTGTWESTPKMVCSAGYRYNAPGFKYDFIAQWEKFKGITAHVISSRVSSNWLDGTPITAELQMNLDVSGSGGRNVIYTKDRLDNLIPLAGNDGTGWKSFYWNGGWVLA
jgi:hypothetical protein